MKCNFCGQDPCEEKLLVCIFSKQSGKIAERVATAALRDGEPPALPGEWVTCDGPGILQCTGSPEDKKCPFCGQDPCPTPSTCTIGIIEQRNAASASPLGPAGTTNPGGWQYSSVPHPPRYSSTGVQVGHDPNATVPERFKVHSSPFCLPDITECLVHRRTKDIGMGKVIHSVKIEVLGELGSEPPDLGSLFVAALKREDPEGAGRLVQ